MNKKHTFFTEERKVYSNKYNNDKVLRELVDLDNPVVDLFLTSDNIILFLRPCGDIDNCEIELYDDEDGGGISLWEVRQTFSVGDMEKIVEGVKDLLKKA